MNESSLLRRWGLPRAVVTLGLVSLLTDFSSEMIYPLLPAFLTQVLGAGALALGLIEGVAEATAALLKIVSGALTDRSGRRKPLVVAGYTLSGLSRPLIGLAPSWTVVLLFRFSDRVGKGLRTSPRDALIADWTPPERRGAAFGLHRAMDHLGAVLGPLAAAGLLALGFSYRGVFLWAAAPAALVVIVLLFAVREHSGASATLKPTASPPEAAAAPRRWPLMLAGAFTAALGTPTDAFLLLLLSRAGLSIPLVAVLWSAQSLVRFASSLVGGVLSDRAPRMRLVSLAWGVRAALLAGLALAGGPAALVALFLLYGAAAGASEPAERAIVADIARRRVRGRAFGLYHGAVGLGALPAGVMFGALWDRAGREATFLAAAGLLVVGLFLLRSSGAGSRAPAAAT